MSKYNALVRKNILLQKMTTYVSHENEALENTWDSLLGLDVDMANDDVARLVQLFTESFQETIRRANNVRDLLNDFFDETGELDSEEDVYVAFPHYELSLDDDVEGATDSDADPSEMNQELTYENTVVADDDEPVVKDSESEVVAEEEPVVTVATVDDDAPDEEEEVVVEDHVRAARIQDDLSVLSDLGLNASASFDVDY